MTRIGGKLVIVSGPSGAGKSTVIRQLLQACPVPLRLSVSATTRARRKGEEEGRDYYFLTPGEFQRRRERDEFLECKEVFGRGDWYGTLRSEVAAGYAQGKWVLLEIDVAGAAAVLAQVPDAVTIFIHPGSVTELQHRLLQRGTETPESFARRLEVAGQEMNAASRYKYVVVNDTVERAVGEICDILTQVGEQFDARRT
jgi:guanylate kinase